MSSYQESKRQKERKETVTNIGIVLLFAAFFIGLGALLVLYVPKLFSDKVEKPKETIERVEPVPEKEKPQDKKKTKGFGDEQNRTL